MAASFGSATFLEAQAGDGWSTWPKKQFLVVKPLPAGNTPVVQDIGADIQRATISAVMTATELSAMYDQVLESDTLTIDWESHSAFLEGIGGVSRVGFGDLYFATLTFIRL